MTAKTALVEELKKYFETKGKFLDYLEYTKQEDAPFRAQVVKRYIGPWARLERLIGEVKPLSQKVETPKVIEPTKVEAAKPGVQAKK